MRGMKWIWIIILGLLASACGDKGKVYQIPIDETRAALLASGPIDLFVMPGKMLERDDAASSDTVVVWRVRNQGAELLRVKAALSAENALATRVNVSLEGGHSEEGAAIAEALDADPKTRNTYVAAAEEALAAKIENRGARVDDFKELIIQAAQSETSKRTQLLLRRDPALAAQADRLNSQVMADIRSGNYVRAERGVDDRYDQYRSTEPSVDLGQYK